MFLVLCERAVCMKFDFGLERYWNFKNKEIQDSIQLNPLSSARTYPGITFAVAEVVRGLVRLFPHRKNFAIIKGSGPFYEEISDFLGMEGLARAELNIKDLKDADACVGKIAKDCLFVLGSYDDPMTGEVFPIENLYPVLHKNRTFTITLSHSYHVARGFPVVNQYMVCIAKIPKQGAVALLGQRASKVPPLSMGMTDWFLPEQWSKGFQKAGEAKDQILEFERKLPKEFVPVFDQDAPRLFDRSVIRALEFDGEACIQLLAQELNLKLAEPGFDENFETLSLCRWQSVNTFNWYLDQERRLQDLRGVFVIDQKLANATTLHALAKVAAKINALQS